MTFLSGQSLLESTWYEFERLTLRVLQHVGWEGLMFTSKSHDQGADIIGIPSGKSEPVIIQCKHTGSSVVSYEGVNDLRHACDFYQTSMGILATNAKLSAKGRERLAELNQDYRMLEWNFSTLCSYGEDLREVSAAKKNPRSYQQGAIDAILDTIDSEQSGLVMFATGLGKSIVLAETASFVCSEKKMPVLLLADRVPLIEQLELSIWPQLSSSIPTRLWDGDRKPKTFEGVTVATYQSVLSALRDGTELPRFGAVLVDECHHALSPTYRECLNLLDKEYLLGVTATPWRGDQQSITDLFGQPLAVMGIVEGIEGGFLADVDYEMFLDDVNWETVSSLTESNMTIKDLNSRLFLPSRDEDLCSNFVERWNENNCPQCITFCKSIDHAERLAELLSSMGLPSRAVHSRDMPQAEKAKHLTDFRAKRFANLIGVDLLNEGVDVPDVAMVVFARVTHSRRIFVQQLGRGLRVTDEKKMVRVLDFVADIRRIAEGARLNQERGAIMQRETYRGDGASMVKFNSETQGGFVEEYLSDIADLEENDRVHLNFINP